MWANEQSIREIYLKPFELSVKEGGTTAVMSSYSRLGNTWAGASKALLTDVLRNEWGFHGMVVTDSAMGNTNWMDVNLAIRAGGDMMLCLMGVKLDSSSNTAQQAMRRACHNILYTQAKTASPLRQLWITPPTGHRGQHSAHRHRSADPQAHPCWQKAGTKPECATSDQDSYWCRISDASCGKR